MEIEIKKEDEYILNFEKNLKNKNINIIINEEDNEKDIENKINEIFNSNNIIENQRENYKKEIYNQIKFQINQRKLFYLIYIINIL